MPVADDWWPEPLFPLRDEAESQTDDVTVAEIGNPWGPDSYRHRFTALVPEENLADLLSQRGFTGHDVSATGPHPTPGGRIGSYQPRFRCWGGEPPFDQLEPLVLAWESSNRTVLVPDPGFLMTYGLIPRAYRDGEEQRTAWDDPSLPEHDVVVARSVSVWDFPAASPAWVRVKRRFLEDYMSLRGCALVELCYAHNTGPLSEEIVQLLAGNESVEFNSTGRTIGLRRLPHRRGRVDAEVWRVRALIKPGGFPVSGAARSVDALTWPNIPEPVTRHTAQHLGMKLVYVKDTVLEAYQRPPDFRISPEYGAVAREGSWGVSYVHRLGRDLLALEVRKLYEGCPDEVIEHWNKFAVPEPPAVAQSPNVATRARRLVYALLDLGERIAGIESACLGEAITSRETVRLLRANVEYYGWWKAPGIEPITRCAPLDMSEDSFLARCAELHKPVIEGLSERPLRRTLIQLGVSDKMIERWGTLRLLQALLNLAKTSIESGLGLNAHSHDLVARTDIKARALEMAALFHLNALRVGKSHLGGGDTREAALEGLGIERAAMAAGWGHAFDIVYDRVAESLEATAELLGQALL